MKSDTFLHCLYTMRFQKGDNQKIKQMDIEGIRRDNEGVQMISRDANGKDNYRSRCAEPQCPVTVFVSKWKVG